MLLILITYLAGVLTILSPCILPVLPFVFSRSQKSFIKSGLPLLAGMALTFSAFSALAIVGGDWIAHANEVGRMIAMALFTVFGLSLIFPQISEKLVAPLTRAGSKIGGGSNQDSFGGSFLLGISTGLLWTPCAGPILGLVLTGVASQHNLSQSIVLLTSYSLGAATSLALALVAGNKFLGTLKKFLGVDRTIKKGLGIAVLLGVIAIALNLDRTFLTHLSKVETGSLETKLLNLAGKKMPPKTLEGELPDLSQSTLWLNSKPLKNSDLRGKVVLVDFWTYSCINCLRTLPYLKAWNEKYKNEGLVIIGVHTPEFAFEKNIQNVEQAIKDLGVTYPVLIDSDYKIWNAFHNEYWPAHYLVDRDAQIRNHHFGEGAYEETERLIQDLLSEDGRMVKSRPITVQATGIEAARLTNEAKSPETYIGYARSKNFTSETKINRDNTQNYKLATNLKTDEWSLGGAWLISKQNAVLKSPNGKISFRFHARDLHLVLGGTNIKFKVTIDGHAPGEDHGADISSDGLGEITSQKLYQLIRQKPDKPLIDHTFEIELFKPEAEAYAFTFG